MPFNTLRSHPIEWVGEEPSSRPSKGSSKCSSGLPILVVFHEQDGLAEDSHDCVLPSGGKPSKSPGGIRISKTICPGLGLLLGMRIFRNYFAGHCQAVPTVSSVVVILVSPKTWPNMIE